MKPATTEARIWALYTVAHVARLEVEAAAKMPEGKRSSGCAACYPIVAAAIRRLANQLERRAERLEQARRKRGEA